MSLYCRYDKTLALFAERGRHAHPIEPNAATYTIVIEALLQTGEVKNAYTVLKKMEKDGPV